MSVDPMLAAVIGADPMPRAEVTRRLWDYIKARRLQDGSDRHLVNADEKLLPIFRKPQVTMLEMTLRVNEHLL